MKIWLRRTFALAMISLGIALFFLPFNNTRSGWVEKEIVKLQLEDFLRTDTIEAQFPKVKIVDITRPEMNEEDYPNLWWAFIDLDKGWSTDTCEIEEWERFQELVLGEKVDTSLILFRGVLSSCIKNREKNVVSIYYLGEYNLDLKELSDEDLSRFPNIQKIINELETGSIDEDTNSIPVKVWKKFVDRYLEPLNDYQCFYYNEQVYGPDYRTAFDVKEGEIVNLSVFLKVIGFVLLLLGLFVIRKLYFKKRGIMVNPKRVAVLYDVIVLLLAVPSA